MDAVERIDHLVLNVTDVETSARWYERVLGMRPEVVDGRMVLWFGDHKLHVRPLTESQDEWFTAEHPVAGSDDLCFSTASTIEVIVQHLDSLGVTIEEGPILRAGARGEMTSVYMRDPDGSLIEISTYSA